LRIFSDAPLSASALAILEEGTASHELFFRRSAESVLVRTEPDPALGTADIAFGQPDVPGVLKSERLRWIHLTSAGYTRYDTPEFRAFAKSRGLLVTNSSAVYAEACAEHGARSSKIDRCKGNQCRNHPPKEVFSDGLLDPHRKALLGDSNAALVR
jgi:phosphoglycerate dehydrogenase-like enzyme